GLRTGEQGVVRVAASMTLAVYVLPFILAEFHRRYPQIRLNLLTRNSEDALGLVERAEANVAFIEGNVPILPQDLAKRTLFKDEIVLAVRPDHNIAGRGRLASADLSGLEIVRREPGSGTREV